jgi:hypothetical protein
MMEAASIFETSVNLCQTTWPNSAEDIHLHGSNHSVKSILFRDPEDLSLCSHNYAIGPLSCACSIQPTNLNLNSLLFSDVCMYFMNGHFPSDIPSDYF